ncbi:MAG: 2-C-methyl-D-erythritol 4-phosphate cytidylyltransferase, partial [Pseudomonadota bacterium]
MHVAVLLVAAGRGTRLGGALPKQYAPIAGATSLERAARAFLAARRVASICAVIHPDDVALYAKARASIEDPRLLEPALGGTSRAQSVLRGLEALAPASPDRVLIHDAARPFVTPDLIDRVIAALDECEGAFAALPVVDALWRGADGLAQSPVSRDGLWRAQTPQGFHFSAILAAHRASDGAAHDDVEVARAHGLRVRLVEGAETNYKITHPAD